MTIAPPTDHVARRLFVALVGLSTFFAFASLATQIEGLVGAQGILPAAPWLDLVSQNLGADRWWRLPTLFYFGASDTALVVVCWLGAFTSIVVMSGRFERPALIVCWLLYLSISIAGRNFLAYQWDILLLEVLIVAALVAPSNRVAPPVAKWLVRLVLFKLMFSSGWAKLASGDVAWRELGAMFVHYETQPLPTPLAWFAHHLPLWFHRASVVGVFFIQLVVPFFVFVPGRVRAVAIALLAALQILIALTGNYCFFNLLALALCVGALDDRTVRALLPKRVVFRTPPLPKLDRWFTARRATIGVVIALNVIPLSDLIYGYGALPEVFDPVVEKVRSFRLVNGYGLFAVMTTERPEIVIEGSQDGERWLAYELPAKPGRTDRVPPFVAPHQPRLDWQMWFAALTYPRREAWVSSLLDRMLEGSPQVMGLFDDPPFDGAPPRYVRARMFDYRFTSREEHDRIGAWWRRVETGVYLPTRP
ncbi:MAG: lipase maturation factor family protein [Deltaproteobacteria bacterium]